MPVIVRTRNICLVTNFNWNTHIMEVFDSKPPSYSEAELLEIANNYFGKSGRVKPLVSERDQNARLIDGDDEYVIKIANTAEDRGLIEFQNAVLNHVSDLDPSLAIPKVIKGENGQQIFRHNENNVRLITFLKGDIFNGAAKSLTLYKNLGSFMGRFSNAMQGFGHPMAHQPDFLWNLDNAGHAKKYIDDIEKNEDRELIKYFFERYDRLVVPRLSRIRSCVIHSDANDHNLVVQGDEISGLIDFGDMLFAKQINELAITLGYAVLDQDDIFATANALITGYVSEFLLEEEELEVLFDLAAMRLVTSVCISSNRASKAADATHRAYLEVTQKPALAALKRLKKIGMSFLSAFSRKIGGYNASANKTSIQQALVNTHS
ncbi:MAG: phosphotransferase, partial [Emcibacteraceae bacterium]|nr:phosphotransferase [Emcibacteraceae bacterium]